MAPKPSGDGVLLAAERLGIAPERILVVGDFDFDMEAGRRAGALTAHVGGGDRVPPCDFPVAELAALQDVIRMGLPLTPGKLPNDLLERFLADFQVAADPSLIVQPGIGQDTAAVAIDGTDTLVLTSDPITFATDRIGHYAVLVNANDMATSGAIPRWLLVSLLLPPGTTPSQVRQIMHELCETCSRHGIVLCGGHTEISDAVTRPVISATMTGTVARSALIEKHAMTPGDRILVTKAVAVEGTAIIARERGAELLQRGLEKEVLQRAQTLIEQIGILDEARICVDSGAVTALHDVTRGGAGHGCLRIGGRRRMRAGHRYGPDSALRGNPAHLCADGDRSPGAYRIGKPADMLPGRSPPRPWSRGLQRPGFAQPPSAP